MVKTTKGTPTKKSDKGRKVIGKPTKTPSKLKRGHLA